MDYGEAYDYLNSLGFNFYYDNSKSIYFSDTHVIWQGKEVGVMYKNEMQFYKDGYVRQFTYNGWYSNQEFKNFITDMIMSEKEKQNQKMLDDIKKDFQ